MLSYSSQKDSRSQLQKLINLVMQTETLLCEIFKKSQRNLSLKQGYNHCYVFGVILYIVGVVCVCVCNV